MNKTETRPELAIVPAGAPLTPAIKSNLKLDLERVAEALREHKGMVASTARYLRVDRSTINRYIKNSSYLRQVLKDERELVTDTTELRLFDAIDRGEAWAVCFYLKTQGKDRGYIERHELTGKDGENIAVTFTFDRPNDYD